MGGVPGGKSKSSPFVTANSSSSLVGVAASPEGLNEVKVPSKVQLSQLPSAFGAAVITARAATVIKFKTAKVVLLTEVECKPLGHFGGSGPCVKTIVRAACAKHVVEHKIDVPG